MTGTVPKNFQFLTKLKAPSLVMNCMKLFGTKEVPGKKSNPVILKWAEACGLKDVYVNDGIAWCGLLMAYLFHLTNRAFPLNPLWALNWRYIGVEVAEGDERIGDWAVWERFNSKGELIGGHIGLLVGKSKNFWFVLGGNQSDTVMIVQKNRKQRCWVRRPDYSIGMPKEAVLLPVFDDNGAPSSKKEV